MYRYQDYLVPVHMSNLLFEAIRLNIRLSSLGAQTFA